MGLQKLVCAVEDVDFQVIEGAVVGHDLVEIEEGVVPAPKQQARGLVLAVVGPDGRETRNVRPVVGEDLELDVNDPWPRQALPVEMPALRWIEGRQAIGLISDVLVAGCLEAIQSVSLALFASVGSGREAAFLAPVRLAFPGYVARRQRRWCSMRVCGNREKIARHRERA